MRQVETRIVNPAVRYNAQARVLPFPTRLVEDAVSLAILAAFWGTILFLALLAAVR